MTGWFEFKGVKSTEYGIIVSDHPPITIPEERVELIEIPGRTGHLTKKEGRDVFNDITLEFECWVADLERLEDAIAFLRGSGTLRVPWRTGAHYDATVSGEIEWSKVMRGTSKHRKFKVKFTCAGLMAVDNVADVEISGGGVSGTFVSGSEVIANGNGVHSLPIMKISPAMNADTEVTIRVTHADSTYEEFTMSGITADTYVDSETMRAYAGGTNMNGSMVGDFPMLLPGNNTVTFSGKYGSIKITPNFRKL